jgi:hypothetical protein
VQQQIISNPSTTAKIFCLENFTLSLKKNNSIRRIEAGKRTAFSLEPRANKNDINAKK